MARNADVWHLDLSVALEMARVGRELVAADLDVGAEDLHRGGAIIPVAVCCRHAAGRAAGGGAVDDRSRVLLSACLGALLGGVAGYLFLMEDGRHVRERLEPGMDDVLREVRGLRSAAEKARLAAAEGVMVVEDLRRGLKARPAAQWAGRPPAAY